MARVRRKAEDVKRRSRHPAVEAYRNRRDGIVQALTGWQPSPFAKMVLVGIGAFLEELTAREQRRNAAIGAMVVRNYVQNEIPLENEVTYIPPHATKPKR